MIFENTTNTTILIEDGAVPIKAGERFYINEKWLGRSAQALNANGSGIAVSVQNMIAIGWIKEIKAHQKDGKGWDQIADPSTRMGRWFKETWVDGLGEPILVEVSPKAEKVKRKKRKRVVTRTVVPPEKKKAVAVDRWDFIP